MTATVLKYAREGRGIKVAGRRPKSPATFSG
jgi:hypothetical protein